MVKQASKPQPFINVATSFSTALSPRSTTLSVMADTSCQSCLAGIKTINHVSITAKVPVTMEMHAANNVGINILGATILRFSGHSPSGQLLETRQLTYITNYSFKVFLSRETCSELGMTLATFSPSIKSCHTTIFRPLPLRPTSGNAPAYLRHRLFIQSFS